MHPSRRLVFGPFDLEPTTLELRRDGFPVPLEPLPARILLRLAQQAGSLVPRGELLELGWPELPEAAEQSLNTCIYQVRHALGGVPAPGVTLETFRGRGYRLTVERSTKLEPGDRRVRPMVPAVLGVATLTVIAIGTAVVVGWPGSVAPLPTEANQLIVQARYLADDTQDLVAARSLLDSARARFPEIAAVHAEWADVSFRLGDLGAAATAVNRAFALDPLVATALRVRAGLALLRGDWAVADAALEQAARLGPRDTRTITLLAFRRTIQGRLHDSDRLVREAALIDPLSGPVHNDAGLLHLLAGRFDAAERSCREALRFKPGSPWATDCLFDVAVLAGRVDAAADWGRRLLRLYHAPEPDPTASAPNVVASVETWQLDRWIQAVRNGAYPYGLALAYAAHGQRDEAMRALWAAAERPQLSLLTIAVDPRMALLRDHPAFPRLLNHLKLRDPVVHRSTGG